MLICAFSGCLEHPPTQFRYTSCRLTSVEALHEHCCLLALSETVIVAYHFDTHTSLVDLGKCGSISAPKKQCNVGSAGAFTSMLHTFAALQNAKESKLRKALKDLGYGEYLGKYAWLPRLSQRWIWGASREDQI